MAKPKATTQLIPSRLIPLRRAAREIGIPYGSLRDAHFRGQLAIVRLGRQTRYAAWYVERGELNRWIESRTERVDPVSA